MVGSLFWSLSFLFFCKSVMPLVEKATEAGAGGLTSAAAAAAGAGGSAAAALFCAVAATADF